MGWQRMKAAQLSADTVWNVVVEEEEEEDDDVMVAEVFLLHRRAFRTNSLTVLLQVQPR
jgi:hypothetical protein